jgi:hypothetical protein
MWRRGIMILLFSRPIFPLWGGGTGFQAEKGSIPGAWRLGPWIKKKIGGSGSRFLLLYAASCKSSKVQKFSLEKQIANKK